jgi:hypothetical protein
LIRFRREATSPKEATDIVDKELGELRKKRWDTAFNDQYQGDVDKVVATNRKATIVIEHLLQASDDAHTMQHWHVFVKWNERLFQEMS